MRVLNARRIAKNLTPESEAFAPRAKSKKGKIRKRARMFKKLRAFKHLTKKSNADGLEIGFNASTSLIALVHHYGLRDRLSRHSSKKTKYPARPLLGFSDDDKDLIMDAIEKVLTANP